MPSDASHSKDLFHTALVLVFLAAAGTFVYCGFGDLHLVLPHWSGYQWVEFFFWLLAAAPVGYAAYRHTRYTLATQRLIRRYRKLEDELEKKRLAWMFHMFLHGKQYLGTQTWSPKTLRQELLVAPSVAVGYIVLFSVVRYANVYAAWVHLDFASLLVQWAALSLFTYFVGRRIFAEVLTFDFKPFEAKPSAKELQEQGRSVRVLDEIPQNAIRPQSEAMLGFLLALLFVLVAFFLSIAQGIVALKQQDTTKRAALVHIMDSKLSDSAKVHALSAFIRKEKSSADPALSWEPTSDPHNDCTGPAPARYCFLLQSRIENNQMSQACLCDGVLKDSQVLRMQAWARTLSPQQLAGLAP